MHFSALVVAALAAVASAGPAMKRQAECPEVGNIPACGVSLFLSLSLPSHSPKTSSPSRPVTAPVQKGKADG